MLEVLMRWKCLGFISNMDTRFLKKKMLETTKLKRCIAMTTQLPIIKTLFRTRLTLEGPIMKHYPARI
jgi:hypothetical protein